MHNIHRTTLARFLLTTILLQAADAHAYFLSWEQKGELLRTGRISDDTGNIYNVRIVPGYASARATSAKKWSEGFKWQKRGGARMGDGLLDIPGSLKHLGDYATPSPYRGVAKGADQSWRAEKYLYRDFMGRDLTAAWSDYWTYAHKAQQRKSFGWWFAYPWATGKGAVNSTLRVTVGLPSSVAVAGYGLVLRPAYEIGKPPVLIVAETGYGIGKVTVGGGEAAWGTVGYQAAAGTALPLLSAAWTTGAGVPMGLIGKEPTPRSTDGWWVSILPGSPGYDQSLDEDSRLRLDGLGAVLEYEMGKHRLDAALKVRRDSRDSAITAMRALERSVNDEFDRVSDSLRSDASHGAAPAAQRDFRPLGKEEEAYLRSFLNEELAASPYYLGLPETEKEKLVEDILRSWGPNILATPGRKQESPYGKSGPHTILREESDQIFK